MNARHFGKIHQRTINGNDINKKPLKQLRRQCEMEASLLRLNSSTCDYC